LTLAREKILKILLKVRSLPAWEGGGPQDAGKGEGNLVET
jgi:hypothetical protein